MSKKKKKQNKNIDKLILCLIVIAIVWVIILISQKDYYKIESRVENIKVANEKYKKNNPKYEVVSWLRVQGTDIDYPVIKTRIASNDQEEEYPVEVESYFWSSNYEDSNNKLTNNMFVSGHNIFNLSIKPKLKSKMFKRAEQLMSFVYYDFAKENKYIQLTIDGHDYLYKIFAVSFIDDSTATFIPVEDNISKEEMKKFQKILKRSSIYDYDVDVSEDDKILTLTTCNRFFPDETENVIYISGKMVKDKERVNNYKLKKSKNYKSLEKLWEDVEDEETDEV